MGRRAGLGLGVPDSAYVKGEAFCPNCGALVANDIRCQWGAVPGSRYAIGDPVTWLRDDQQSIITPYTLIDVAPGVRRWNCGDPRVQHVLLFDLDSYGGDIHVRCGACQTPVAVVAVVRNGVFQQLRALDDAEARRILGPSREKANAVIVRDDGSFWPREDWFDKTVEYRPLPLSHHLPRDR